MLFLVLFVRIHIFNFPILFAERARGDYGGVNENNFDC